MSWALRYKLPWSSFQPDQVRAAVAEVLRRLPQVRADVKCGPDSAVCYFEVPLADAREWDVGGTFDRDLAEAGLDPSGAAWVEVCFWHLEPEPRWGLEGSYEFFFDTAHSGNGLCSGAAIKITDALGQFFGVQPEPI
jgi:hypothetical protein